MFEMIPSCPKMHHGLMVADHVDPDKPTLQEWFCRICGIRLYGFERRRARKAPPDSVIPTNAISWEQQRKCKGCDKRNRSESEYCRDCRRAAQAAL
jgi:hypothetical protein